MNTNNGEGNTQIPAVEELVIEDGDDVETIKTKVAEHAQKVKDWQTKVDSENKQLYARTKKSEGFELVDGKWVKPSDDEGKKKKKEDTDPSEKSLNQRDLIALINAKIPEEDMDEVLQYAEFRKISVKDALESPVIKNILATKEEMRKTAEGANTGGNKRGTSKVSDETLVANADKGIMPESDDDIKRLTQIKLKQGRK